MNKKSTTNRVSDGIKDKRFAFAGRILRPNLHERLSVAGGVERGTITTDRVDYMVVGELASQKVLNWAKAKKIKQITEDEFAQMLDAAEALNEQAARNAGVRGAQGKIFCLTGFTVAGFEAWRERIEEAGGVIAAQVTQKTNYLVVGPGNMHAQAKLRDAERHKVKILDEEGLRSLLVGKTKAPNLTLEEMAAAVHAHGGEMTISLTPKDLFSHVKQMYFKGRNWYAMGTHWTGYFVPAMANSFGRFAPYMLCIYDSFFLDTKHGHARVTAISDDGIRYELLDGSNYVWLHTIQDIQAHELKEQKPII